MTVSREPDFLMRVSAGRREYARLRTIGRSLFVGLECEACKDGGSHHRVGDQKHQKLS